MNYDDDELNVDKSFIDAYIDASCSDIPDMWGRIEAGFKKEFEEMKSNERTAEIPKNQQPKEQYDFDKFIGRIDKDRIYDNVSAGDINANNNTNVVEFKKKKKKSQWISLVAAALLVCVIAIPLSKNGLLDTKKKSDEKYDDQTTAASMADESGVKDADSYAADAVADETGESVAMANSVESEDANIESEVTIAARDDEADTDVIAVNGEIKKENGAYSIKISEISGNKSEESEELLNKEISLTGDKAEFDIEEGTSAFYSFVEICNVQLYDIAIAQSKKIDGIAQVVKTGKKTNK